MGENSECCALIMCIATTDFGWLSQQLAKPPLEFLVSELVEPVVAIKEHSYSLFLWLYKVCSILQCKLSSSGG